MPQGRYDPRLKSLLEQKYGKSLPDELFQTDNSELSGARDRYKERAQTGNDLAFMSKAASRMGQLGGKRSESMYDPATVKGISQGASLDLGAAKEDYSDRDKVRKYVADKYLTKDPESKVRNPWMSTGKQDEAGNLLFYNKETGDTKAGPKIRDSAAGIDKKAERSKKEASSRYKVMQGNLKRLSEIIEKTGTFELMGPESGQMDALIYNIALDYAKLVDPESVAREGEVKAAQQYMLPVKGLFMRDSTAQQHITDYQQGLKDRLASQGIDFRQLDEEMGGGGATGISAEEQAELDALEAEFGGGGGRPR